MDIVERLRFKKELKTPEDVHVLFADAAAEIERLRSGRNACEEQFQAKVNQILGMMDEIERLREALNDLLPHALWLLVQMEDGLSKDPELLRKRIQKARAALGEEK